MRSGIRVFVGLFVCGRLGWCAYRRGNDKNTIGQVPVRCLDMSGKLNSLAVRLGNRGKSPS